MRCHHTSSSAIFKAMLLVCLAGLAGIRPAFAETAETPIYNRTVDRGYTFEFATFKAADPYRDVNHVSRQGEVAFRSVDNTSRADLYTLTRLAVEELEFLAGIRILWDQAEKQFDRVALKLKLKGDISLSARDSTAAQGGGPSPSLQRYPLVTRSERSKNQLCLRALLLPDKIRWHFGLDPHQQVLFGELKWGRFIALQSDVGSHQDVRMVFHYDF
jgi:hypothetical protein